MPQPECGCRFWGNQYGHGYSFCTKHGRALQHIALARGITTQEAFNEALEQFFERMRRG